ncbi:MAG: transferrin receptor-like dimerization domain-containing protein [Ginsengibacter sp.]
MKKLLVLTLLIISLKGSAQTSITGFTVRSAEAQVQLEKKFDQLLDRLTIGKNIKRLSAKPHNLGSAADRENAEYLLNLYKSWGWDARIETFKVLFPTPLTRKLKMLSPVKYTAVLKEPSIKEDATSGQPGQLPTYNAWSADGNVTGDLVFVNYGLPGDYEKLALLGIDVKGKIVIAKYGHSWRGIKPKVAQEHGAIGCIIYSDPGDDGYGAGDVYPVGAFKNEYGVQRGSVMDMVVYPGDPLTPGIGATEDAKRIDRSKALNLIKIPVLPISYHDAKPLLAALGGPVVPAGWRGGLPFTYHIGPGKVRVHLQLSFDWKLVSCYDVIAMMKGSQFPDQWVIRGNHHDAWVNGASDPISGQSAMLEEARVIGELIKNGWKPKRTLVYCSWDGEEPGLLGSTEWVEFHEAELKEKAVVYINTDESGRGFLYAEGSHALTTMVDEVSKGVIDPQTHVSVYQRKKAAEVISASSSKEKKDTYDKKILELGALGSGSDFSAFLQHAGIPSIDIGYSGEDNGGIYHSIYDSYDNYVRFKDPGFYYGVTLAQTSGHAALRMAESDLLPFDFRILYNTVNTYSKELMDLLQQTKETTEMENVLIKGGEYLVAADPTKKLVVAQIKEEVPYLDFSSMQNALEAFKKSADTLFAVAAATATSNTNLGALNTSLYKAEQQLLTVNGLPRRGWYKHSLYAPGFYTGYGVKTMPGIREAIEQRNWKEAQEQINIDAAAINKLAEYLYALGVK